MSYENGEERALDLGPPLKFIGRLRVWHEGRKLLFFGGNDYHRLSHNPDVQKQMIYALYDQGNGLAGSRMTTANHAFHVDLENTLAKFFHSESTLLCPTGYLANIIHFQGIADEYQKVFLDARAHGSLVDAALNCGFDPIYYKTGDSSDLRKQLSTNLQPGEKPLVATDSVFAAIGDSPPLADILEVTQEYGGKLYLDDAHAVGVLGENGKGSWSEWKLDRSAIYQTGTLSKAFGTYGGFIVGSEAHCRKVRTKSRAFIGSSGIPAPIAAATKKAVEVLDRDPDRVIRLRESAQETKRQLAKFGLKQHLTPMPLLSVTLGSDSLNKSLGEHLKDWGIYPSFINYPGSPAGGHFRFCLSSAHSHMDVDALIEALKSGVQELGLVSA